MGTPARPLFDPSQPTAKRPQRVGGQIGSAAVEGERPPTATERGPTAVVVLQVEQPFNRRLSRGRDSGILRIELQQREDGSRSVVRIGNAAGQIRPGPTAGGGVRVAMHEDMLLF